LAISHPESGLSVTSLAAGANNQPAQPCMGNQAGLKATSNGLSAVCICSTISAATAAPAEWPTTTAGFIAMVFNRACTALAMPGSVISAGSAAPVSACPGKSTLTTVNSRAHNGMSSRQVWVDAPVPCNNTMTGPRPCCCTCQRTPAAWTNWLQAVSGQSSRQARQSSGG
jgi:hypothetical protein